MKHISETVSRSDRERLKRLRDSASPGLYSCRHCRDLGMIYVQYGTRLSVGVVPCPMCVKGADRHIDGNVCIWARGFKACPLCGAREGEQIPAGFTPKLPTGYLSFEEVAERNHETAKPSDEFPF